MEIIQGTTDFQLYKETAAAIGKFDGVHIGHRRLLDEILARRADGLLACVFTFDPPPAVLFGGSDGKELTTKEEKRTIFEYMGVDVLIEFPLNEETAATPPEVFVREILAERMQARFIAAGEDLSFGAGGAGDTRLLQALSEECSFDVRIIEKVCIEGAEVSSSRIRCLVEQGQMEAAERMLGMPYTVHGRVVRGNQIGRTLGFPTVNLLPAEEKLLPPNGVYCAKVRCGRQVYRAVANVGRKPTVSDSPNVGVEAYLYDFDREIYDEAIEVELLAFRRPERRFGSLEELQDQVRRDIRDGQGWHGTIEK